MDIGLIFEVFPMVWIVGAGTVVSLFIGVISLLQKWIGVP